ncbi:MAG: glycosyltransferase family 9 protein, partial [Pseudomonadota bacterium]
GLKNIFSLYRTLSDYDIILDLQGNLKSSLLRFFIKGRFHRIQKHSKERRAFVKKRRYGEILNKHVCQKYFTVFQEAFEIPDLADERLRPRYQANPLTFAKDFDFSNGIVVHPFASQKNKVWPHYKDFLLKLVEKKHSVIVVGQDEGEYDIPEHEQILNLTNKTNLGEMASLMAQARAVISTDSGPMHLAVALSKPTLCFFGPTTKEFGFYPEFEKTKVLEMKSLDCRPCHVHGGNICPKEHFDCLTKIDVETAYSGLEALLGESPTLK